MLVLALSEPVRRHERLARLFHRLSVARSQDTDRALRRPRNGFHHLLLGAKPEQARPFSRKLFALAVAHGSGLHSGSAGAEPRSAAAHQAGLRWCSRRRHWPPAPWKRRSLRELKRDEPVLRVAARRYRDRAGDRSLEMPPGVIGVRARVGRGRSVLSRRGESGKVRAIRRVQRR